MLLLHRTFHPSLGRGQRLKMGKTQEEPGGVNRVPMLWGTEPRPRPPESSLIHDRLGERDKLTDHSHGAGGVGRDISARLLFVGRLGSGIYLDAILEHKDMFARSLIEYLRFLPHG